MTDDLGFKDVLARRMAWAAFALGLWCLASDNGPVPDPVDIVRSVIAGP